MWRQKKTERRNRANVSACSALHVPVRLFVAKNVAAYVSVVFDFGIAELLLLLFLHEMMILSRITNKQLQNNIFNLAPIIFLKIMINALKISRVIK